MTDYQTGTVVSADQTTIGFRILGRGPAVVAVHGGMQAAQHLMQLGAALSADFTVYLPDRRGRGLSGGHGEAYCADREAEDLAAVVRAAGAHRIFGLSSGALASLRTARDTPELDRVALYEPPLSVAGSVPVGWVDRYEREIAAGRTAAALVTALKGIDVEPTFARTPRFILTPLLRAGLRLQAAPPPGDVAAARLVPTQRYDMKLVREMADTLVDYAALDAEVLLLGGGRSPRFLGQSLDALSATLPRSRRVTYPDLGHSGPDNDGDPTRVAGTLREFFS
jgi:pimeloyl-ACP methyl ester carboxylesterase